MEDYQIKSNGRDLSAFPPKQNALKKGERAASNDLTLVFRTRADALEFIAAGEAEDFTFAGKELMG